MDVHRAHGKPHCFAIDEIEVDELLERLLERRDVIDAERPGTAVRRQVRRRHARHEKARHAEGGRRHRADAVEGESQRIEIRRRNNRNARRHAVPECDQALDPPLGRIAGQQGGVDRTDRNSRHPVRREAALGHAFVDSRLVGAQRAAALKREDGLLMLRQAEASSLGRAASRHRGCVGDSSLHWNTSAFSPAARRQTAFP